MLAVVAPAHGQPAGAPQPAPAAQADAQGKIVALHGRVEHALPARDVWNRAQIFQPLFTAERVRTLAASRAAVLFIDETQVKLNAGAVLTVHDIRGTGGGPTVLELLRGEGWFRTKNPRSGLTIRTPAAAAAVRGTEINLVVRPDDETVLTVVEGAAEFSNAQGSILVNAGEEGSARPGVAPTKRVILNPEDAVQWALYYPAEFGWRDLPPAAASSPAASGFERLRAGDAAGALPLFAPNLATDVWSRIGSSMAYAELGDAAQARAVLAAPPADAEGLPTEAAVQRHAQLAAAALAAGDVPAARAEIGAALALDPTALRPLVLLSSIELRQNRAAPALDAAGRALAAHPESVSALVAIAEVMQSRFELRQAERYLDRAIAVDPGDVRALVNRARLRFGNGDTAAAQRDVERAAGLAPSDEQVRTLQGFIKLASGNQAGARLDFEAAIGRDVASAEPHLGLGLLHFRQGRVNDGLLEMLTATLLEPKVSLYQSYLGKAYYQAGRFPEGLAALDTAKRLDTRDPTPWLYTSMFLRDQNRQADALRELKRAIALNDNRAVYRSRFLLDRDLATKNVSLAEVYRQLGFEAWGAYEALNSLEADVTNASAHLFLAETYGRLPDRTQALSSELLQYFLYAPVNRNSFHAFNEYTALLEEPGRQLSASTELGSRDWRFGDVVSRSGNDRFAHNAFVEIRREDGARLDKRDDRVQAFFQGKLAIGAESDLFLKVGSVRRDAGADEVAIQAYAFPIVQLRQFTDDPDPILTNETSVDEGTAGFKHTWRPGATLTAAANILRLEVVERKPFSTEAACESIYAPLFLFLPMVSSYELTNPISSWDLQAQQTLRAGRHQFLAGVQLFRQQKERRCRESLTLFDEPYADVSESVEAQDRTVTGYVRDEIALGSRLHVTMGARYQDIEYEDQFGDRTFTSRRWDPHVGASARLSRTTVVRAAAFRNVNSDFVGAKISPTTVAGFIIERNEFPTARRREFNVSLENSFGAVFVAARGFARKTEVPLLQALSNPLIANPDAEADAKGSGVFVNWIVAPRFSVFGDDLFIHTSTAPFVREDHQARVGANFIHPRGIFVRLTDSYITQRFSDTGIVGLPKSSYNVVDLETSYEFAGKRALVSLTVRNLSGERFTSVVEGLSIEPHRPRRHAVLRIRWRF
ncbi:MAG TPA: TonB-dependent receptor [Vicinamibacterales bacterium]|nr:TonB-dependent receptor [Vicinamibacterales bacterium]